MAGTVEGGKKAAATNKLKYGDNFYRVAGAKGGRNGHTGGFAANRELASIAGKKGGRKSRRGDAAVSAELRQKIGELYESGMTQADITRKLELSVSSVRYHLTKLGVL